MLPPRHFLHPLDFPPRPWLRQAHQPPHLLRLLVQSRHEHCLPNRPGRHRRWRQLFPLPIPSLCHPNVSRRRRLLGPLHGLQRLSRPLSRLDRQAYARSRVEIFHLLLRRRLHPRLHLPLHQHFLPRPRLRPRVALVLGLPHLGLSARSDPLRDSLASYPLRIHYLCSGLLKSVAPAA